MSSRVGFFFTSIQFQTKFQDDIAPKVLISSIKDPYERVGADTFSIYIY